MIGQTLHAPRCAVCGEYIARVEPTKRDSKWTHGMDVGRKPLVTKVDKKLNADHEPRI